MIEAPEGAVVEDEPQRRTRPFLLSGVAVLAFALGALFWNLVAPSQQSSSPVTRFSFRLTDGQTLPGSGSLAVSPDGSMFAYTASSPGTDSALYLRAMDQLEARLAAGTDGARAPFLSSDGQWVAYFSEDALRKVSIAGGAPIKICDVPGGVGGKAGARGPDDTTVSRSREHPSPYWRESATTRPQRSFPFRRAGRSSTRPRRTQRETRPSCG